MVAAKMAYPTGFHSWGLEEQKAIQRVIASNRFTMGPEVEIFEGEFAAYHNMKYCIAVNSGSSANLIAITTLCNLKNNPLRRGDRVLVPAIAWATTYAPLQQSGLDLVLQDVDQTWNASLASSFDTGEVRLIVGCSILGNPAALDHWQKVAKALEAYFIEDNCESLGAVTSGGKLCGTYGIMNTFSGFHSHQLSCIEMGMILTNDAECARLCRILRAHGWTRDVSPPTSFEDSYNFTHFGYNLRPLEMHAAIAREQLRKLKGFIKARQANARLFRELTKTLPVAHPTIRTLDPSPFGLPFTVASSEVRCKLVVELAKEGVDSRLPTGGSFTRHKYGAPWRGQLTPNADKIHDCGLFLGNGPFPLDEQIGRAVGVMQKVLA